MQILNLFSYIEIKNNEFNNLEAVHKEASDILGENNPNTIKFFEFMSQKKEEFILVDMKKFTAKDKNTIVKLLEEISYKKWIISDDTMTKLKSFIKDDDVKK